MSDLTGSAPPLNDAGSTAGLTHEWNVDTAYYKTKVPIWVDEIADVEEWKSQFLQPEAKEVVEAIGAWVYCVLTSTGDGPSPKAEETMKAIQEISEEHAGYGADTVMLAVTMPSNQASSNSDEGAAEQWEDVCLEYGFEYVDYRAKGSNEFGEKTGFERMKEALEANEWTATLSPDSDSDLGALDLGDEDDGGVRGGEDAFTRQDEAEMTAELFGMKAALAGTDDFETEADDFPGIGRQEKGVEDLDRLMGKLLVVKEQGAGLPEAQRKRMAAQAVRELLGESMGADKG